MYCDNDLDQERIQQADAAQCQWEAMGATDAAFGTLPQYSHAAYLAGYVAKLSELPTDVNGRLIHYRPTQHFAWGYVDNPNPSRADEF